MALKKTLKTPKPDAAPSEIQLVREHVSNPILITAEDVLSNPTRIQIRAPRPLVIRGYASNQLDVGAVILLPENTVAEVKAIQPDAHMKGYGVESGILVSGDEVRVYFRNYSMRTVNFEEGDVVAVLTFARTREYTVEVDVALPEVKPKMVQSRAGRVPEGELPFEN